MTDLTVAKVGHVGRAADGVWAFIWKMETRAGKADHRQVREDMRVVWQFVMQMQRLVDMQCVTFSARVTDGC